MTRSKNKGQQLHFDLEKTVSSLRKATKQRKQQEAKGISTSVKESTTEFVEILVKTEYKKNEQQKSDTEAPNIQNDIDHPQSEKEYSDRASSEEVPVEEEKEPHSQETQVSQKGPSKPRGRTRMRYDKSSYSQSEVRNSFHQIPCKYLHNHTLFELALYHATYSFIDKIEWRSFFLINCPIYDQFVRDFYSSFSFEPTTV